MQNKGNKIKSPSPATLKKYGLTYPEWFSFLVAQEFLCPICKRSFIYDPIRPVIDHYHQRNYKKLPPEQKKKYVRGVCCVYCNQRLLIKGITLQRARAIASYLEKFEERLATSNPPD